MGRFLSTKEPENYIDYLDMLKNDKIKKLKLKYPEYEIKSKEFYFYEEIKFSNSVEFKCNFIALKLNDISIMLEIQNIKLYLSDYDIIKVLVGLPSNLRDEILNLLSEFIKNRKENISFFVKDKKFSIKGVKFTDKNELISIYTGYRIHLNDFIGLLNLIMAKENTSKFYEKAKHTMNKYILFTSLFVNSNESNEELLKKLEENNIKKYEKLSDYKKIINNKRILIKF